MGTRKTLFPNASTGAPVDRAGAMARISDGSGLRPIVSADLAKLTPPERDALPSSAFVFPADRRYPIHDKGHAQAALMDSRGTKDEAAVRAAVKARYPSLSLSLVAPADIDLTRHVRTPAGVRYFHKPIGSPIGGGTARRVAKATLKKPAWEVNGKGYNDFGEATAAAGKLLDQKPSGHELRRVQTVPVKVEGAGEFPTHKPGKELFKPKTIVIPAPKRSTAPAKVRLHKSAAAYNAGPSADPIEAAILGNLPDQAGMEDAQKWWTTHMPSDAEKAETAKDMGLKFPDLDIKALRKQATNKKATPEVRAAHKAELVRRVALGKKVAAANHGWLASLTKKIDEAPKDADLAPIIGETLAEHPNLGPLAHIWDRMRLSKYNFRHHFNAAVAADKAGDIARGIGATLLVGFLIHLGINLPISSLGGG